MKIYLAIPALMAVTACSSPPDQVEASYVSPSTYSGQTCSQLNAERTAIVTKVSEHTKAQKKAADNDAVMMGVGLILFWPAVLAVGMGPDSSDALASAKGNYDAINAKMVQQGC